MPESTELWTICSALEHFSLPAALCNIENNTLVNWNRTFQRMTGLPDVELAQKLLSSLILLDESFSGIILQDRDPEKVVRFVPCVLKRLFLTNGDWTLAGAGAE